MRLNGGSKSSAWHDSRTTWPLPTACFSQCWGRGAKSTWLELHGRDRSLSLYTTIHRAVTEVVNPMIFSRPPTEGRFLSQKVWVIATAGTSCVNEQRSLVDSWRSRGRGRAERTGPVNAWGCPRAASAATVRARRRKSKLSTQ